ncbi:MAG: protein-glutamate methylesterase/protein-glutamine glutaminase [Alkalispirochaeta sp.]
MSEIGVLVVDDSALMRNLVSRIINSAPDLTVVGTAMNGQFALDKLPRLKPDVIVLDLEMPEMNGIEFLRARREREIDIPVIILSSIAQKGAQVTMDALALGAGDFITKPSGAVSHNIHQVGEELIALVRGFGTRYRRSKGVRIPEPPVDHAISPGTVEIDTSDLRDEDTPQQQPAPTSARSTPPTAPPSSPPSTVPPTARDIHRGAIPRTPKDKPGTLELIVIGISTGGPNALRKVFAEISPDLGVPVVIVQHMPAGFTTEFAQSLNRVSPLEIKEATEGDVLKPNRVLVAPGNYHIEVEKRSLAGIVHISQSPPVNGHRPSVGVLFQSAARHYGKHVMGVIMTGMGRDGAYEIGDIYEAGGMTIGQDEASSVVYGMPRVAQEIGYLHRQVPLHEIASTVSDVARELRGATTT